MHKGDERSQQLHERIQGLEKENSGLHAQVSKYKSEMHHKEQQAETYQQQGNDLYKQIQQGKDVDKNAIDKLTGDIQKERKQFQEGAG